MKRIGSPTLRTARMLYFNSQPSLVIRISSSSFHSTPAPRQLKLASRTLPRLSLTSWQLVSFASNPVGPTMMWIG
jgi:hypothetical protein